MPSSRMAPSATTTAPGARSGWIPPDSAIETSRRAPSASSSSACDATIGAPSPRLVSTANAAAGRVDRVQVAHQVSDATDARLAAQTLRKAALEADHRGVERHRRGQPSTPLPVRDHLGRRHHRVERVLAREHRVTHVFPLSARRATATKKSPHPRKGARGANRSSSQARLAYRPGCRLASCFDSAVGVNTDSPSTESSS